MKNFVLHFIALLLYNAGTKSEQHREWLPADARKAHGCAIYAAALPAQKRKKTF